MPDAHQGYGVSIGSVLATEGVVIPKRCGSRYWLWHGGYKNFFKIRTIG